MVRGPGTPTKKNRVSDSKNEFADLQSTAADDKKAKFAKLVVQLVQTEEGNLLDGQPAAVVDYEYVHKWVDSSCRTTEELHGYANGGGSAQAPEGAHASAKAAAKQMFREFCSKAVEESNFWASQGVDVCRAPADGPGICRFSKRIKATPEVEFAWLAEVAKAMLPLPTGSGPTDSAPVSGPNDSAPTASLRAVVKGPQMRKFLEEHAADDIVKRILGHTVTGATKKEWEQLAEAIDENWIPRSSKAKFEDRRREWEGEGFTIWFKDMILKTGTRGLKRLVDLTVSCG